MHTCNMIERWRWILKKRTVHSVYSLCILGKLAFVFQTFFQLNCWDGYITKLVFSRQVLSYSWQYYSFFTIFSKNSKTRKLNNHKLRSTSQIYLFKSRAITLKKILDVVAASLCCTELWISVKVVQEFNTKFFLLLNKNLCKCLFNMTPWIWKVEMQINYHDNL